MSRLLFTNARLIDPASGRDERADLLVADGRIAEAGAAGDAAEVVDLAGAVLAPGLVDMRVFVGEPGFDHRETFASASRAAAAGGVTTLVTMPDTDPVIDDPALVDFVFRRARDTAGVRIRPMAAMTKGQAGREMTEFGLVLEAGAVAFTSGRGSVASAQVMRRALAYARDFDALVMHFPQDATLAEGVMNLGETATRLGLAGIPAEAETIVLARDIELVRLTGGRYHAGPLSTARSVEMVRAAKREGLPVTASVAVTHLTLNEIDVGAYRTFFKLSPPLRSEDDRLALVAGLADGTIDVIVSGHDPQDAETKRQPFAEAADGAVGLETLLAAALRLHHSGDVPLPRLLDALSAAPARLLGIEAGTLRPGAPADLVVFDPDAPWVLSEDGLRSRSKNTPYEGARFSGKVLATYVGGRRLFDGKDVDQATR